MGVLQHIIYNYIVGILCCLNFCKTRGVGFNVLNINYPLELTWGTCTFKSYCVNYAH